MNVHIIVSLSRFLTLETIKEAIVSSYALIRLRQIRRWRAAEETKNDIGKCVNGERERKEKIDDHSAYDIRFKLYICLESASVGF